MSAHLLDTPSANAVRRGVLRGVELYNPPNGVKAVFRHMLYLPTLVLLVGTVTAADPDPRSLWGVFGQPQPHGEPVQKGFIGLSTGRTNLHFGQPMRVDLFTVNPTDQGAPYLDLPDAPLELTDAAGKPVPFRQEDGGSGVGNGLSRGSFTLWPTKDHTAGVYWKPGTYKLKMTVVIPNEQPPAKKILTGTFRTNELVFTVREFGAAPDTWDGKGQLRSTQEGVTVTADDMFLYVAALDDESSERLRKTTKDRLKPVAWKKTPWRVAAAQFAPVTVPQDRKLTDAEVKQLITDLKDQDAAVRIRAVRSVPPTAPVEVLAAAANLLLDQYEQGPAPFAHAPTYPLIHIAADALCRLGTPAVEPLIAFAEANGHKVMLFQIPPRQQVAAMLGRIGPNDAAEKYLRAAIQSGDDDRVGAAQATAKAWGKGGVGLTRAILALPKLPEGTRKSAIAALGEFGELKTDGPALRPLLASTERKVQQSAITALAALRDTDSLPALRKLLDSTDPGTRNTALSALMALGDAASLPEFERLARDVKAELAPRRAAVDAVQTLADAKTSGRLVLDLMGEKNMRYDLLWKAGRWKIMAALPPLLDALDDADESIRHVADYGLRQLAGNIDGVGYDGKKPDAKLWRNYWAKKEKK